MFNIVKIIKYLLVLNALAWVVFSIYGFVAESVHYLVIILMMFNAVVFLWLFLNISKNKYVFYFAIFYLIINIVLSVTDQVGIYDIIILILNIITTLLLVFNKNKILHFNLLES